MQLDISQLKLLYKENVNIMALFREVSGLHSNSQEAILTSYDLQSGSYINALGDPDFKKRHDRYCAEIAGLLFEFRPGSVLEAGIGEATTLCSVLSQGKDRSVKFAGFDISWSRVDCARRHADHSGFPDLTLSTGDLSSIPFVDDSFDVVYTAHAIEPNHGREKEILLQLLRVARRRVALFEPSYELGGEATRRRIEEHGYCRGLPSIAEEIGAKIVLHQLLQNPMRPENATAVLVLEKTGGGTSDKGQQFGCPRCRARLRLVKQQWFCDGCSLVYPVISGIPCLLRGNGILATHFPEHP